MGSGKLLYLRDLDERELAGKKVSGRKSLFYFPEISKDCKRMVELIESPLTGQMT